MIDRIMGVLKLDVNTFEEIEHDQNATTQAALVVLVAAIANGLGGFFTNGLSGLMSGIIASLVGWVVWSAITYFVGTRFFEGEADLGEMLRVVGFAHAPQILGIIPCLGQIVGSIWSLVAGFIAVRQGLDIDNQKAALTIGVGFLGYVAVAIIMGLVFGVSNAALSGLTG